MHEHRSMNYIHTMVQHWFCYTTAAPPHTHTQRCPKEEGEGRYESAYLLAFVHRTAVSVRVLELLTSSPAYLYLLLPVS